MRMTDEENRSTVAAMNVSDADKAIIERRALAGESARFAVYSRF
jgi:hypothetical protein